MYSSEIIIDNDNWVNIQMPIKVFIQMFVISTFLTTKFNQKCECFILKFQSSQNILFFYLIAIKRTLD